METRETLPLWEAEGVFSMVDVGDKPVTRRRAVAAGRITMSPEAFALVRDRGLPKGDALALAEVAGVMAAKRTSDWVPLCHPLELDRVSVAALLDAETTSVLVTCEASAHAKTGVEMEALTGATAALLCVYDLVKPVDPALVISDVRLRLKEGGKRGHWVHPAEGHAEPPRQAPLVGVRCAVVTLSDRASRGELTDRSGPLAAETLQAMGAEVVAVGAIPDDKERIWARVRGLVAEGIPLIVTTGGTGLGPRDFTAEALAAIATREIKGIGECLRATGARRKQSAWLSNAGGFLIGEALVVALPGSPTAVREGLEALGGILPHALQIARGGSHEGGSGRLA